MASLEKEVQTLNELELTTCQARIYLTLLKNKTLRAQEIAKASAIARPHVYRALADLQSLGIVEKQIGKVSTFSAVSFQQALRILLKRKSDRDREIEKKTEEILQKYQHDNREEFPKQDYKFIVVDGKERLLQLISREHDNAQRSVDILSTVQRWIQIIDECFENYWEALERGVKYRVVTEKPNDEETFRREIRPLFETRNFELRLSRNPLPTNSAIFDEKEATFTFFPSRSLGESPLIWTNHPSFLAMARDHFETLWRSADIYRL